MPPIKSKVARIAASEETCDKKATKHEIHTRRRYISTEKRTGQTHSGGRDEHAFDRLVHSVEQSVVIESSQICDYSSVEEHKNNWQNQQHVVGQH
jgi:hypothetical protein